MKRAPGTFLSALGSNPPRFSRQIKETSAWMSLLFGGGRWIRTTEGIASRFTVCPIWPLWNSPILNCVGAGGRIRTPDLLITNVGRSVNALISGVFSAFVSGGRQYTSLLRPSSTHGHIPVWVTVWVKRFCGAVSGSFLPANLAAQGAQDLRRYKQRISKVYHIIFFCIVRIHSLTRSRIRPLSRAA